MAEVRNFLQLVADNPSGWGEDAPLRPLEPEGNMLSRFIQRGNQASLNARTDISSRYVDNSLDALSRIPRGLWNFVPESRPSNGGEPEYVPLTESPLAQSILSALEAGGHVAAAAQSIGGPPGAIVGAIGRGLRTPEAVLSHYARQARSVTPAGQTANALEDTLLRNAQMQSRLTAAKRPLPASGPQAIPELYRSKKQLRSVQLEDAKRREAALLARTRAMEESIRAARANAERAKINPYVTGLVRDERGRLVSKSHEARELARRQAVEEGRIAAQAWSMETASRAFHEAAAKPGRFRQAMERGDLEGAARTVSKERGLPSDAVLASLREWVRRQPGRLGRTRR